MAQVLNSQRRYLRSYFWCFTCLKLRPCIVQLFVLAYACSIHVFCNKMWPLLSTRYFSSSLELWTCDIHIDLIRLDVVLSLFNVYTIFLDIIWTCAYKFSVTKIGVYKLLFKYCLTFKNVLICFGEIKSAFGYFKCK